MNVISPIRLDVGIHPNIPEHVYHSDPAPEISASASILKTLYTASPEHARHDHPRLNPTMEPRASTDAQATGTILHSIVLGQPTPWRVCEFDDWRTTKAKDAKAAALADGLIPILPHKLDEILPVADSLRARIEREHPELHAALTASDTQREVTMIWRERDAMCRCRFDILPASRFGFSADLKFTGRSANPEEWSSKLRAEYLFQAGLYPRAVKALRGDAPEFRFVVCETDPPYGVSVHALAPDLEEIARRRVDAALARWSHCLRANDWPGYPSLIHYAQAPGWFLTQEDDRALRDNFVHRDSIARIAAATRMSAEIGGPLK